MMDIVRADRSASRGIVFIQFDARQPGDKTGIDEDAISIEPGAERLCQKVLVIDRHLPGFLVAVDIEPYHIVLGGW